MDEDQEITRGQQAEQLLRNELLNEALEAIEARYEKAWKNSKLSQEALREESYRMLCAVNEFRAHLTRVLETGKLASIAKQMREENDIQERKLRQWDGSPDRAT